MSEVCETPAPPRPAARVSRIAITAIFVLHGALFASWVAHIPGIKSQLRLNDGSLGLALLGAPIGSISAMLLVGPVLARVGSRPVVRVTLVGYCLVGPLVGLVGSAGQLFAALAVWGVFHATLDVSMNAQGIAVEKACARPIMSTLHGSWSIGSLAGAGVGALGVALGVSLTAQLLLLGVPCALVGLWQTGRFTADLGPRHGERTGRSPVSRTLVVMGAIAFAALLCEGAAADWSAVYLRETLDLSPGVAGLGYAVYMAAMVTVRLAGARLQARTGPRLLVGSLAALATLGMTTGLLSGHPVLAMIGFGTLGIGLASVIPVLFSAAGNQPGISPGTAVATVSAIGWAGFMCGPAVIGFLADRTSQAVALGLVPVLTLLIACAAWRTPALSAAQPE